MMITNPHQMIPHNENAMTHTVARYPIINSPMIYILLV